MNQVFDHDDYRIALRKIVEERRQVVPSLTFQRIAQSCNIQKTYLSRVIAGKAHLNSDQMYKIARYLNLATNERNFLLLLLENIRSDIPERKKEMEAEIESQRRKELKTESHIQVNPTGSQDLACTRELFLDPILQTVLMFLTIPRFQKSPELISEAMRTNETELNRAIEKLLGLKLLKIKGKSLMPSNDKFHLPADDSAYIAYRSMMKARTLGYIHSGPRPEDYFFSVLFSANEATFNQIRKKFLLLLRDTESVVDKSAKTDVYQMNFDLFAWSRESGV